MFWVYSDNRGNFVKIVSIHIGKTKSINKSSYWENKKAALSWFDSVKSKFPNMELKKCGLKIVE